MTVVEILMVVKYCLAAACLQSLPCLVTPHHSLTPHPASQLSQVLLSALNQDLIQFALRPGVQVNVYATRMSPGQPAASLSKKSHVVHFGVGETGAVTTG